MKTHTNKDGVRCHKATRRIIVAAVLASAVLGGCKGEFPTNSAQYQVAEGAYDSELLKRSLSEIEAWHIEHKTGLTDSLREGVAVSSIEAAFSGKECRPTVELKALWSWRNGEHSPVPFVWYHDFLSMEEAQSEYNWLLLNPLIRWDPKYIPVFTFEGEWYAIYCGPKSAAASPIAHFYLEDTPRITHINITTFLSTMAETLRSGAVSWEDGAMVDDIGKVYRVHQKHNIGYEFPYYVPKGT